MQACDIYQKLPNKWQKLSQSVLIIQLYVACFFKMPYDRRRKAYYLSHMIKRSFQHTAFIVKLHPTTTLFPTVSRGPIVAHNPLFEFRTPHISKFTCLWVKHYRGLTRVNTDVKDLYARIIHVIVTSRTFTPISLQSSILKQIFFPFLAPQRLVPITFGIKQPSCFQGTGHHFESVQVVGHILAFVPAPKYVHRENGVTLNNETNLSGRGHMGELV